MASRLFSIRRTWWITPPILLCGVMTCLSAPPTHEHIQRTWAISIQSNSQPVLQDAYRDRLLLLRPAHTGENPGPNPMLLVWQSEVDKPSANFTLRDFASRALTLLPAFKTRYDVFRFTSGDNAILGVQAPWLVNVDSRSGEEKSRVLPCDGFGPQGPAPDPDHGPDSWIVTAISSATHVVAVGCNIGQAGAIATWDVGLRTRLSYSTVPRLVQDLAWSPDGSLLAVLWWTPVRPYNSSGKWDAALAKATPKGPTLSLFDADGKIQHEFATGRFDAKIGFSPDGKTLYSISHAKCCGVGYSGDWANDDLRAYDVATGALLKKFSVAGSGVRGNFALSPEGKLIAAESTVDVKRFFLTEQVSLNVDAGFVILDSTTGGVVFRERRKTEGDVYQRLPLFFSSDGAGLFVGFNATASKPQSGAEVVEYRVR